MAMAEFPSARFKVQAKLFHHWQTRIMCFMPLSSYNAIKHLMIS